MKTTSDKIAKLIVGIVAYAIVYLLIGFMASWTLSAFHPHDYPLWGFAAGVATINLLAEMIRMSGNSPSGLSASDNR